MGMTDREKVLHGLSSCGNDYGIPNICEVTECPYRETGASCVHNLAHDASMLISELLKAHEPRVMTLEEVAGYVALERETPIYMEFGYMATHAGQVMELNPRHMYFDDENGLSWCVREGPDHGKQDGVRLDEYNDIWRCWTACPTDAQRKAVKWK